MELHFFKEFLMISHPTTVFLLLVFLLILAIIWRKKAPLLENS